MPLTPRKPRRTAVRKARPRVRPKYSRWATHSMAAYYADHVKDGRALLPRIHQRQQTHWLVRFDDLTRQRTAYAQCFEDSLTLYLYRPEDPVSLAEDRLRTVEHIRAVRPSRPGRRRSLSTELWLAQQRAALTQLTTHTTLDTHHDPSVDSRTELKEPRTP